MLVRLERYEISIAIIWAESSRFARSGIAAVNPSQAGSSPLTEGETADYVAHRLRVAGAEREIFDPQAIATLHMLSHGVPRQINRLCDLALLIGVAEQRQVITGEHLEAVNQELVTVVPE